MLRSDIAKALFVLLLVIPPLAFAEPSATPAPAKPSSGLAPTTNLSPIITSELPERCRPVARMASAPSLSQALSTRISLANCIADARLEPLKPLDSELAVMEFDTLTAPALELLDEVIVAGEPVQRIVALRAKGELYTAMTVRMLASIPASPAGAPVEAQRLREQRRIVLLGWTRHWDQGTREAFTQILEIIKREPTLVENPLVRNAAREAERRLSLTVTMR